MTRFTMDCGCEAMRTWRALPVTGGASIPVPDGARIVSACEAHARLEGTAFELDDNPLIPTPPAP